MEVFEKIRELLETAKISYEVIQHEPVYTSADAAKIRDTGLSNGAKALVCIADKTPILLVLPGDKKVDFKKFKLAFLVKDLAMASKEEVRELTSLEVGAIPPVGRALSIRSYFDESLRSKNFVAFNAGSHVKSIKMKASDLIDIENPVFGDFVL